MGRRPPRRHRLCWSSPTIWILRYGQDRHVSKQVPPLLSTTRWQLHDRMSGDRGGWTVAAAVCGPRATSGLWGRRVRRREVGCVRREPCERRLWNRTGSAPVQAGIRWQDVLPSGLLRGSRRPVEEVVLQPQPDATPEAHGALSWQSRFAYFSAVFSDSGTLSMYSNTLTTRCTPVVVRAISTAASASAWVTMPIR